MKTYKNFIAALAAVLMLLSLLPSAVFAAEFPKHENYIADEAGILTEDTISSIRDMNKTLAGDLQLTIAVCTVNTIGNDDIAEYARDLFKEWKLGEGVLILIAKEDNNYYFVPSTGVEDILTNEELANIRDAQFEEDFSNGVYARAVHKVAFKLKNTLVAGFQTRAAEEAASAAENSDESSETEENKGTTVGSVIVGFFKALLWIAIIAVLLFVGLFVWAMFNEDVAALLQKYIFRRNSGTRSKIPQNYYDDRLYANRPQNPGQRPSNAQRRPNPNGYYGNNGGGYPGQQAGYLTDGRNYGGQGYPQQNGYGQPVPQNYNNNRGGYPAQGQYPQQPYPNQQGGYAQPQRPQQNPYSGPTMNPNYGYAQQQGYPQQQNGYYNNGQQGYPQQNQYNPYGGAQQPQQNYNNRPGYGAQQQNNNDATVQFNIPRRS